MTHHSGWVINSVCKAYGITVAQLLADTETHYESDARKTCVVLLRKDANLEDASICRLLGRGDSNIRWCLRQHPKLMFGHKAYAQRFKLAQDYINGKHNDTIREIPASPDKLA